VRPDEPTYESVMADALDYLGKLQTLARNLLAEVANAEKNDPKASKRDIARGRWTIFLGVQLLQVSEGIAHLAPTQNARALAILSRSIFEYEQKAEFFLKHRDEAFEQFASIGARTQAHLAKLAPNPAVDGQLLEVYEEWKRTSGNRDEYSGEVKFAKMHMQNTEQSSIKTDKNGKPYTEEFQSAYTLPSLYVHGDPFLMPEVFPHLSDDANWEFCEDEALLGSIPILGIANIYLLKFCAVVCKAYRLDYNRVEATKPQFTRIQESVRAIMGYEKREQSEQ
jgi:hypothetical protein